MLNIEPAPDGVAPRSATMIRVQIQSRNRFRRSQQHRQLQLCVPLVNLDGESYRLRDHHAAADTLRRAATGTRQPLH
jgi:hypothetical protein